MREIIVKNCGHECPFNYNDPDYGETCTIDKDINFSDGTKWENGNRYGFPLNCQLRNENILIKRKGAKG